MKVKLLWQKLALGLISLAVTTIVVTYLLVNYVIDIRFQGYLSHRETAAYERIGESLAVSYIQNGGWNRRLAETLPHFAMMNQVRVEVVDVKGRVVGKTGQLGGDIEQQMARMMGIEAPVKELRNARIDVPIIAHGSRVGTVFITPLAAAGRAGEDEAFRQSINSSLLFGGLLAALVALGLSFIISTRLTQPLGQMTKAAKKMEDGDLSQRVEVETEDEIGQLGEAFNHLAMSLERQEALRKTLTADVAHELRTPLATIRSHIEACIDGVMKPDTRTLESIHDEIMRLGRLVDDLGELAKAESGKLELHKRKVDLSQTAKKAAVGLEPLFAEHGLKFEVITNGKVVGDYDEDKIKQVLVNLLVNAAKFTPRGGRVSLKVSDTPAAAIISVADTGQGIEKSIQPFIFERFYRADKSRSRATGGSGIGLTIASELVKMHGGSLEVESDIGAGSEFTVRLPKEIHKPRTFSS